MSILDIPEDEVIKALLSAFTPCQPGALRGAWRQRNNYGVPPSTREIWELYEAADFRCQRCGSQLRITIDHKNDDPTDNRLKNLQVLCADCNLGKREKGVVQKNSRLRIFKAMMELYEERGVFPDPVEIRNRAGVTQLSGARYMVKFFQARLDKLQKLRPYSSTGSHH